jgi:hypothetical protein
MSFITFFSIPGLNQDHTVHLIGMSLVSFNLLLPKPAFIFQDFYDFEKEKPVIL